MMTEHELSEITLKTGDEEIVLKRGGAAQEVSGERVVPMWMPPQMGYGLPAAGAAPPMPGPQPSAGAPPEQAPAAEEEEFTPIRSPMVGTFYAASDPNAPPYVSVGATVTASTVVCIVEAMKVFNEIKAEVSGTIAKVLVKNEEPVEFGQTLFLVRPD